MESHQLAENLYCTTKLSQEEISSLVGVNRKTLYTWIKDKNWVRQPQAEEVVPLRLLSKCYSQIEYLLNESEFVDPEYCQHHFKGISVMIRAVNSLKPKKKENPYATVMTEFMKQIRISAPGLADSVLPFICQFIETHNLEMPTTPPPPTPPVPDNPQKNDLNGFMAPQNQPNETTTSRPMKCATPRKRLIKPKKTNSTPKPAQTGVTAKASKQINKNNTKSQKNLRIQKHPSHRGSDNFNGVHGASLNNNKLLHNNRYDIIINNLGKESNNTTPTPNTPFSNFLETNTALPNAETRTPFSDFLSLSKAKTPNSLPGAPTEFPIGTPPQTLLDSSLITYLYDRMRKYGARTSVI